MRAIASNAVSSPATTPWGRMCREAPWRSLALRMSHGTGRLKRCAVGSALGAAVLSSLTLQRRTGSAFPWGLLTVQLAQRQNSISLWQRRVTTTTSPTASRSIQGFQGRIPVRPNCRVERTLSKGGMCSARATNKFARASLGVGRRGAAHAER